jgi:hypothetical protein
MANPSSTGSGPASRPSHNLQPPQAFAEAGRPGPALG